MNTFEETVDNTAWTEVLAGQAGIAFNVKGKSDTVRLHHNEVATPPAGGAPEDSAGGSGAAWDYQISGLAAGVDRIWIRAFDGPNNSPVKVTGIR